MSAPQTTRPTGPDVTHGNSQGIIYLGNINGGLSAEDINGSVRFLIPVPNNGFAEIQLRENGEWNTTGLDVDENSINLGKDMSLGAAAGFLETNSKSNPTDHNRALIPHTEFNESGTEGTHSPELNDIHPIVFFGNPVSEITSTVLGQVIVSQTALLIDKLKLEVGSIGATETVTLRIYTGTDNSGILFYERHYSPSIFIANQQTILEFMDSFGFDDGGSFYQEITSPVAFSLQTDVSGNIVTEYDAHDLTEISVVTSNRVFNEILGEVLNENLEPVFNGASYLIPA